MTPTWLVPTTIFRLRQAYRYSMKSFSGHGTSLWAGISQKQADIHEALLVDDDSLTSLLTDPCRTYLYYGVDNMYPREIAAEAPNHQCLVTHASNTLVTLADALGATRCWNPEGGALFPHKEPKLTRSADDLLSDIENVLGIALKFPSPFPGESGLSSVRGLVTYRAVNAIYQAYRVHQITMGTGRCMEVGGGVGRTAYFARMLGINDYTLVDLPMTLVGQALFLMATLGSDAVWLIGEPVSKQQGCIRLVPPAFVFETSERFDIVLNVDSFTEMDQAHAKAYIDFAMSNADMLLSINHEANQFTVRELASGLLQSRSPYWLRPGYVEELYIPIHEVLKINECRED